MQMLMHILAKSTSRDGQWVVGLIVIVIWVVSAIANAAAKKKREEEQRREARAMLQGSIPPPPPVVTPLPSNLASGIQMRVPRERARPAGQQTRRGKPPAVAARVPLTAPPPIPATASASIASTSAAMERTQTSIADSQTHIARHQGVAVDAAALHRWLRPETLRQQFFVTEVLLPPVALRENWMRR